MLLLRTLGLLLGIAIVFCGGLGLVTADKRWFASAWLLCRIGLAVALVFLVLMVAERLLAPVL